MFCDVSDFFLNPLAIFSYGISQIVGVLFTQRETKDALRETKILNVVVTAMTDGYGNNGNVINASNLV